MASPDKLSLIIQSGEYDRIHYALVMASAALAVGKPVTLFFTMAATRALTTDWADDAREAAFAADGLATFEELLTACRDLDATFMVCELGLRAETLSTDDLRDDIPITAGSAVSFLSDASSDGAMLYV
ncbi:MAG: peroxiredoxin family protein [Paracoccaceae bacterium]|jgi:peroxiredoxin family protein